MDPRGRADGLAGEGEIAVIRAHIQDDGMARQFQQGKFGDKTIEGLAIVGSAADQALWQQGESQQRRFAQVPAGGGVVC